MNRFLVMAAFVALFAAGCSTHYGDAVIYHAVGCAIVPPSPYTAHTFRLPYIELGECREYHFHVKGLKRKLYPDHFYMEFPVEEVLSMHHEVNQPWRSCVISIEFMVGNGKPFFTKRLLLQDARSYPAKVASSSKKWTIGIELFKSSALNVFGELPDLSSYDVAVRVESPSKRKSDWGYFCSDYSEPCP